MYRTVMAKKKIGPYVDEEVWENFKSQTAEGEGVGEALEKAMQAYMASPSRAKIKAVVQGITETELDEIERTGEVTSDA